MLTGFTSTLLQVWLLLFVYGIFFLNYLSIIKYADDFFSNRLIDIWLVLYNLEVLTFL